MILLPIAVITLSVLTQSLSGSSNTDPSPVDCMGTIDPHICIAPADLMPAYDENEMIVINPDGSISIKPNHW